MLSCTTKVAAAALAGLVLSGAVSEAFARDRYMHTTSGYRHNGGGYRHRGIGPGPAIAGAALGVLGAATAGIAADRYYNGYPSYSYGPGYGGAYGYDYHPGHGYYGPY